MQMSLALMTRRRFLPLFITQFMGAMNDNLFKTAMVLFVIYQMYSDPTKEEVFSAVATAISIVPFFLFSAVAGQLADAVDKARMVRFVKTAEIFIMLTGAAGLLLANVPLMLIALFALGVHSSFFGPIKYAILPQHLPKEEVLGGTGLVEAGTYIAILLGTIIAGFISHTTAALLILVVAGIGWISGRQVPPAPPFGDDHKVDWNVFRASVVLVRNVMGVRRLILAIVSISFFWTIGAVLFVQFPPLVKNVLTSDKSVASLFLAIFAVGIAIGSVAINRLLKGEISARFAPVCVIFMGAFVVAFHFAAKGWEVDTSGQLYDFWGFIRHDGAPLLSLILLAIAVSGGMFVVPLYAFLTTSVPPSETARAVGANNFVNAGFMVAGCGLALGLSAIGVGAVDQFLMTAVMCLVSAWLAWLLHKAEND